MSKEYFAIQDKARKSFEYNYIDYINVSQSDFLQLCAMLSKEFEKNETNHGLVFNYKKSYFKSNKDGSMKKAYISVDGDYFTDRECITFWKDRFIGFAGWADKNKIEIITKVFNRWCNGVK